jgi:hypothetical protein
MPKFSIAMLVTLVLSGCGGGSDDDADHDQQFIEQVPTEAVLCSLIPGVSTRADVERVLGEPTGFTESPERAILQYWYGSLQEFARLNQKLIVVSFNAESILESPSVDGIPFPECWRTGSDADR